jgi:uncharacterized protein YhjY with autotransporter beta-barrel domain
MTWEITKSTRRRRWRAMARFAIESILFHQGKASTYRYILAMLAVTLFCCPPAMALPPTTVIISVSPSSITQGEQAGIVAQVVTLGSSPGTLAIWDTDGNQYPVTTVNNSLGSGLTAISAFVAGTTFSVGRHTFYATYSGDSVYGVSTSANVTLTVNALSTVGTVSPSRSGTAGGSQVTITGTNLNTAATVAFGGAAAAIVSSSSNSLVVTTPPHAAGVVDVILTTSGGTVTTLAGAFTYGGVANPAQNAAVVALIGAQTQAVRQFSSSHLNNFNQRLESLHGDGWAASSLGVNLSQGPASETVPVGTGGDTVNYAGSSVGSLRSNMRKAGLTLAAANPVADDAYNLPDLPASTGLQHRALSWWIGGSLDLGQQQGLSGGKLTTGGVSFGGDYRLNDRLTLGVGAGYSRSNFQSDDLGAKSIGQGMVGVVYASFRPTDRSYVDLVAGVGQLQFDLTRYIAGDATSASGSRGGMQAFGSLTAGYEWRGEQWLLSPYGRIDIARARLDSYTESSSSSEALHYFKQSIRNDNASLGLRGEWRHRLVSGTLVPLTKVAYQRSLQGAVQTSMQYADSSISNTIYTLSDSASQSSQWLFSLGGKFLFDSGTILSLIYNYGVSNDQYSSHSVQFSVTGSF